MTVEVFAADEQHDLTVDTLRWVRLAEAVLADEEVHGDSELSILFVDETSIADLNQRFLGKEGPTDVLAFPIDDEPAESGRSPDSGGSGPGFTGEAEEAPTLLGDVVICPKVASRNAPDHAGTYEDELALLVVHGVLHLLGMDHLDDGEAAEMEQREAELLTKHYGVTAGSKLAELRPLGGDEADADEAKANGTAPAKAEVAGPERVDPEQADPDNGPEKPGGVP
jgi:probable rRNA maturation factor